MRRNKKVICSALLHVEWNTFSFSHDFNLILFFSEGKLDKGSQIQDFPLVLLQFSSPLFFLVNRQPSSFFPHFSVRHLSNTHLYCSFFYNTNPVSVECPRPRCPLSFCSSPSLTLSFPCDLWHRADKLLCSYVASISGLRLEGFGLFVHVRWGLGWMRSCYGDLYCYWWQWVETPIWLFRFTVSGVKLSSTFAHRVQIITNSIWLEVSIYFSVFYHVDFY